jgi:hypothetical protein
MENRIKAGAATDPYTLPFEQYLAWQGEVLARAWIMPTKESVAKAIAADAARALNSPRLVTVEDPEPKPPKIKEKRDADGAAPDAGGLTSHPIPASRPAKRKPGAVPKDLDGLAEAIKTGTAVKGGGKGKLADLTPEQRERRRALNRASNQRHKEKLAAGGPSATIASRAALAPGTRRA